MSETVRPTKKQRDLLTFIEQFIKEHGYSPSYREIMNGLNYTSVATVALHVNSLISRGHLRKRDRSARSLEMVEQNTLNPQPANMSGTNEDWLVDKVEQQFSKMEHGSAPLTGYGDLSSLVAALRILGLTEAATNFERRLESLKQNT